MIMFIRSNEQLASENNELVYLKATAELIATGPRNPVKHGIASLLRGYNRIDEID
ncbi:MAG: hypothetical protein WBR15_02450 [Gammaproteobacteria bacterium]